MALNFPSSPATNSTYSLGDKTWTYNGYAWDLSASTSSTTYTFTTDFGVTGITTETLIYSFAIATYRTAKYIIQLTNSTAYASLEVLVSHDGTNAWIATNSSSYASGDNTGGYFSGNYVNISLREGDIQIGTINASIRFYIAGGNLIFGALASSGTLSVKGNVTLIKV
jgi:hypothetical protein